MGTGGDHPESRVLIVATLRRVDFGSRRGRDGGRSVMVIDDDPTVVRALVGVLKNAGMTVHSAGNSLQALDIMRRMRPDVALVDVFMPHASGYELCEKIRSTPGISEMFVIMMSGVPIERGEGRVCWDRVIGKPINPEQLLTMIDNAFRVAAPDPTRLGR
jgi:CheY-like chemotaxis protein